MVKSTYKIGEEVETTKDFVKITNKECLLCN